MSTGHKILDALRERFAWHQEQHENHQTFLEIIMSEVERLIASGEKLLAESLAPLQSENADLKTKLDAANATIADSEAKASAAADKLDAAIAAAESASAPVAPTAPVVTNPTATATITVVPSTAPAAVNPDTGTATEPGTTSHEDTATGVVTTVPHDGTDATAVGASGSPVPAEPSVVAAAVDATKAAGVTVATGN